MSTSSSTVAVVGAGIAGLSAAIRLRIAGKEVIVFEQNSYTGGKVSIRAMLTSWENGMLHIEFFRVAIIWEIRLWRHLENLPCSVEWIHHIVSVCLVMATGIGVSP